MTWWTVDGDVTMPKPVIDLMARAAMALRDEILWEIEGEDPGLHVRLGIPPFDSLEPRAQTFALAYVLRHLSDPDLPSPELHAWNEAAIYALFAKAGRDLEEEYGFQEERGADPDLKFGYRRAIREAIRAMEPKSRPPAIRDRDHSKWMAILEAISEAILWDEDFLDEDEFADLDPEEAGLKKRHLRIADDYFSTAAPQVREEQYREADRYLRHVAGYADLRDPWEGADA